MINLKAIIGTGAGALLIGTYGGWKAHSTVIDARHAKALEAAQDAHREALDALQVDLDTEREERRLLATELNAARSNVRTVTREIVREVPRYVEDSTPDCDRSLNADIIRLYNNSLRAGVTRAGSGKQPPRGSADSLRLAGDNPD